MVLSGFYLFIWNATRLLKKQIKTEKTNKNNKIDFSTASEQAAWPSPPL